jgi:hypothetical protein
MNKNVLHFQLWGSWLKCTRPFDARPTTGKVVSRASPRGSLYCLHPWRICFWSHNYTPPNKIIVYFGEFICTYLLADNGYISLFFRHFKWLVSLATRSTDVTINLLKPIGYGMHQQVELLTIVPSAHAVFMCFVFVWEQTATCSIYIKRIGFYNRDEKCLQRGTDWVFKWSGLRSVF